MFKIEFSVLKKGGQFLLFLTVFMLSMHINLPYITQMPTTDQSFYTEQIINLLPILPESTTNPTTATGWVLIKWQCPTKAAFSTPLLINKGFALFKQPFDWHLIHIEKNIFNCIFRI